MATLTSGRRGVHPRLQRLAATLALLAAVVLFAVTLAWWIWRWFGPAPLPETVPAMTDPVAALRSSGLFAASGPVVPMPDAPVAAALSGDTRLIGIFAQSDGQGYALFRTPAGAKLVRSGQEIGAGATLVGVRGDGITIRDGGGTRDIVLRAGKESPAAGVTTATAAGAANLPRTSGNGVGPGPSGAQGAVKAAPSLACTPPAGFRGTVVRLNAELLQGMINQPGSWKSLAAPERGALAIRDESGFAAMLGMKKGDRVDQANGIALTVPDDIVGAVLKPLAASQQVRLVGSRDGAAREWLVLNAGACAPG
jgi:hypothetical protein